MRRFIRRTSIQAPAADVFRYHTRTGAFDRLTPPWMDVRVLERHGGITPGSRVVLDAPAGPFTARWVIEHRDYVEGRQFRDVQLSGPFPRWVHTHSVEPSGDGAILVDDVEYEMPGGLVGELLMGRHVHRELDRMFRYRHAVVAADLARHGRYGQAGARRIGITGSTGMVGSALLSYLSTAGHRVARFVRRHEDEQAGDIYWSPAHRQLNPARLEGLDAVIHLAGENIGVRWTAARRASIRDSRIAGTRLLARALGAMKRPPAVFVSASAVGYYGDRGDEILDEQSSRGDGFLAELTAEWEEAAAPLRDRGVRVVHLRFGVVLSPSGGALRRLLTPFRLGAGGRAGTGRQWMSWIALDDCLGAVEHALFTDAVSGPVNVVAPEPVRNGDFSRVLRSVLGRPAALPVPAFALKAAFGEMAEQTLLASQRTIPAKLGSSGFAWLFPTLETALGFELGR